MTEQQLLELLALLVIRLGGSVEFNKLELARMQHYRLVLADDPRNFSRFTMSVLANEVLQAMVDGDTAEVVI